jgi:glycosyltransferase involved in cell wall biosynthesis
MTLSEDDADRGRSRSSRAFMIRADGVTKDAELVSCIVPVYNGELHLKQGLASILSQTHPAVEVIVVDDGSIDGTARVAAEFGERIRYVHQSNAGPAAALNLGVRVATGRLLAFLDADDWWHPEKLARQASRFAARPDLAYCVAYAQNVSVPAPEEDSRDPEPCGAPVPAFVPGTLMVQRDQFEKLEGFDSGLEHAYGTDWFLRARENNLHFEMLPQVLLFRSLHATNRSALLTRDSHAEYLHLLKGRLDKGQIDRSRRSA